MMVVVDRLSKMVHFIVMASMFTVNSATQAYYENVLKLYGVPKSIVNDRDPLFTSQFGRSYFGYKGPSSVSLHPTIHKWVGKRT